ncbi:MAG: MBL fold metallo-hydrolase, partial [Myxococcota bacterium]
MSWPRTIAIGVGVALGLVILVPLLLTFGAVGYVEAQLPPDQGPRIRGPHGLVGVQTTGSYAWVIPSATGVVLVDAGLDPAAKALLHEVGRRPIRGILATHGHGDHTGGLAALGDVPVYADPADVALIRGDREPRGWLARAFSAAIGAPTVGGALIPVPDDRELELDGIRVRAVHVPGHTDGSVAWLWDDVLFTGDAVLGGSPLTLAPTALADDPAAAKASVAKLVPLDFDAIADGHVGLTSAARPALIRLANVQPATPETGLDAPPTVSVRVAEGGPGAVTERTGVYVEPPMPDVRGESPVLIVFPDGPPWRLVEPADADRSARAGWSGKSV